jgi:hypothetical protein
MSKELAQHYIDWIRTSPFGKKNSNLPLDMLVKASFNWGIERGLDSKLKGELSKLKSTIKESVNEAAFKSPDYIVTSIPASAIPQTNISKADVGLGLSMFDALGRGWTLNNKDYKLDYHNGKVALVLTKQGKLAVRVKSGHDAKYVEKIEKFANDYLTKFAKNIKKTESVNESLIANDGKILLNGKIVGYYDYDRGSAAFWTTDLSDKQFRGSQAFDTKEEMLAFFKKYLSRAAKALEYERKALAKFGIKYPNESVNEVASISHVRSTIEKVKKQLIQKWKQKGGYENFGEREGRMLSDKFNTNPYGSSDERRIHLMIQDFENWAMNYDGRSESVNEAKPSVVGNMNAVGPSKVLGKGGKVLGFVPDTPNAIATLIQDYPNVQAIEFKSPFFFDFNSYKSIKKGDNAWKELMSRSIDKPTKAALKKDFQLKESVNEAMGNDKSMLALVDILSNSMEYYEDDSDFLQAVRGGQGWSGIAGFKNSSLIPVFKSIYKKYWTVSPQNRTNWITKDWINWLKPFGLEENVNSETDTIEETTLNEKQFKGLEGIPANKSLEKISKAEKLNIIKAKGNIISFIVPDEYKGKRNFWQVISAGNIKKSSSGNIVMLMGGGPMNSPSFKNIDDLINGVDWASMERTRRFNESVTESTPGEQIQNLNNRLTKLRQDMAKAKSPEAKNVIQARMKNALQKLSDKKKDMGIKKP